MATRRRGLGNASLCRMKKRPSDGAPTGLRKLALSFPDTVETVACEGTPLEKRSFKVKKKSFLFLGVKDDSFDVMVKLDRSLADAKKLQKTGPSAVKVGKQGWVTAVYGEGEAPPKGLMEKWIGESYGVMAGGQEKPKGEPSRKKR
jgi:predicted DNA-binding protein (MmcQ/YjbR family)